MALEYEFFKNDAWHRVERVPALQLVPVPPERINAAMMIAQLRHIKLIFDYVHKFVPPLTNDL